MTQETLFNTPESARSRRSDPETSKSAAAKVHVERLEWEIITCLDMHGPQTTKQLASCIQCPRDSISPRMKGLEAKGKIFRTGERRDKATVWALKEKQ
jgi:DNA-binding MarR family transcriptional regulator